MPAGLRALFTSLSESLGGISSHTMTSMEDLGLALHEAAIHGNKRRVRKILNTGILIDYPNDTGQTALFCACFEGQAKIVSLLLKKGANPNIKCREGSTPLHAGAYSGDVQIVSQLVAYGGDLRLHDNKMRSVSDWASLQPDNKKKTRMIDFLSRIRNLAMSHSGRDLVGEKQSREFFEQLKAEESHSLMHLFKRKNSSSPTIDLKPTVQNLGFGKVYLRDGDEAGAVATIPLVPESQLQHDDQGLTYNNGPFMVNESMSWDTTQVTAKRLHKNPLDGGIVDLLINEYEFMSQLRHPNVLLLMGVCNTNNMDGLVLLYERIGLGSLYHHMHHLSNEMTPGQMLVIMHQLCDGLLYLHQHNLVHCYITSHAVHLASPTVIKLGNMEYMIHNGSHESSAPRSDVTNNRYINAAYNWMSPELMAGEQPSELSDVYSLCSVLWEIIHGAVPWGGLHAEDIMSDILELGRHLPLDMNHLGRTLHTVLATGLNPDLTVRSTLSVGRIRLVLAHLEKDREKKIRLGTSISLLNRHWGSANVSLNESQNQKDEADRDASLSTRRYSGVSSLKDTGSTQASQDSLADITPTNSPSKRSSTGRTNKNTAQASFSEITPTNSQSKQSSAGRTKRTAPSPSRSHTGDSTSRSHQPSPLSSKTTTTIDALPTAAPRVKERLIASNEPTKAFTKWTMEDDREIREIVAKAQQSPIVKTPVKIVSAPRLGAQPFPPPCTQRPVRSNAGLQGNIFSKVAAPVGSEEKIKASIGTTQTTKTPRGSSVFEVLSQPLQPFPIKSKVSKHVAAVRGLLQAAGIDQPRHHSLNRIGDNELHEFIMDDQPGNFKPASHRQSLEPSESPVASKRRRSGSLLITDIPSQTGSIHQLLPPTSPPRHGLLNSPGCVQTASLPGSFRSPSKSKIRESHDLLWDQYRLERYQQLMSLAHSPAMTAAQRSPDRISPRDMKDEWFEGSGNIQNLISDFQVQWRQHDEQQAILCLKSKNKLSRQTGKGDSCSPYKRAVPRNGTKKPDERLEIEGTTDTEDCSSENSNNNAEDEVIQDVAKSLSVGQKRYDVEEFYFDDEINPNVPQERHLRLEATVNLSQSATCYDSSNITPNNTPDVTPSASNTSIKEKIHHAKRKHLVTPSASRDSITDKSVQEYDTELSSEPKVLPLRKESLHFVQIDDSLDVREGGQADVGDDQEEEEDEDEEAVEEEEGEEDKYRLGEEEEEEEEELGDKDGMGDEEEEEEGQDLELDEEKEEEEDQSGLEEEGHKNEEKELEEVYQHMKLE